MPMTARRAAPPLALAVALLVPALPSTADATAPTLVKATTSVTATPRVADPPASITCRAVARGSVNLRCVIGHSVRGRKIVAMRQGNPQATRVLVVSGQMHGNEWPGPLIVKQIRGFAVSATGPAQVWTVRTMNPDGASVDGRYNARGVDLNANFPYDWEYQSRTGPRYAGSRAKSEPETRAMLRFLRWVQPDLVISFHGFSTSVDTTGGGLRAARARTFSQLTNITPAQPVPCSGPCHGNMTEWYSARSKVGGVAFTVEMPRWSRARRTCAVPGHTGAMPVLRCAARAAVYQARTL